MARGRDARADGGERARRDQVRASEARRRRLQLPPQARPHAGPSKQLCFRSCAPPARRYGFINFGMVAKPPLAGPSDTHGTVVILGAGLSGLVAARQLMVRVCISHRITVAPVLTGCGPAAQAFGHKVAVVEARERPGGRVHTLRLEPDDPSSAPAGCCGMGELGGSVITGCDGNPLAVVARQLGAQLHNIRDKCVALLVFAILSYILTLLRRCPIYDLDGAPIDDNLDKRVRHSVRSKRNTALTASLPRHRLSGSSMTCWTRAAPFAPPSARRRTLCRSAERWSSCPRSTAWAPPPPPSAPCWTGTWQT